MTETEWNARLSLYIFMKLKVKQNAVSRQRARENLKYALNAETFSANNKIYRQTVPSSRLFALLSCHLHFYCFQNKTSSNKPFPM